MSLAMRTRLYAARAISGRVPSVASPGAGARAPLDRGAAGTGRGVAGAGVGGSEVGVVAGAGRQ